MEQVSENNVLDIFCLILAALFLFLAFISAKSLIFNKKKEDKIHFIKNMFWNAQPYLCLVLCFIFVYLNAGNSFAVSIFNGIGSFLHVSVDYTQSSITPWISIVATLVTLTALISDIRGFLKLCVYWLCDNFSKNEVYVLHTDSSYGKAIKENFIDNNKCIIDVNKTNEHYYVSFKNHILAYESEDYNSEETAKILKTNDSANVYVFTSNNDSIFFERQNVYAINKDELIAKTFWIENREKIYKLFKEKKFKNCNIAIIGSCNLTIEILKYALQSCLYDLKQNINYYIFTDKLDKYKYEFVNDSIVNKMNKDTISVYDLEHTNINKIYDTDITIVTDNKYISKCALMFGKGRNVYIYNDNYSQEEFVKFDNQNNVKWYNAEVFGECGHILNVENIIGTEHNKIAKLVNYGYTNEYKDIDWKLADEEWKKLSIYSKKSSMAVADYYEIRKLVKADNDNIDFLEQLEHIRWCRYMYLAGFRYDVKGNTKEMKQLKMHDCLRPLNSKDKKDKEILKKDSKIYTFLDNN